MGQDWSQMYLMMWQTPFFLDLVNCYACRETLCNIIRFRCVFLDFIKCGDYLDFPFPLEHINAPSVFLLTRTLHKSIRRLPITFTNKTWISYEMPQFCVEHSFTLQICTSFGIQIFAWPSRKVLIILTLRTQDWMYFSSVIFHGKIWIKCRQSFIAVLWSGQVINQAVSVELVRLIKEQNAIPIYYCVLSTQ